MLKRSLQIFKIVNILMGVGSMLTKRVDALRLNILRLAYNFTTVVLKLT